jgi:hypothetical protein
MSSPRLALLLPILGLVLGIGCDAQEDDLRALDATALPERFACGDLTMVAASSDAGEALMIGIDDGLAAEAIASGEVVHADYELPDERLTVRWVAGTNVYQGQCGRDTGESWQLDARLDALAGRIQVRVEPREDGKLELHAELDDVVLADDVWLGTANLELPIE